MHCQLQQVSHNLSSGHMKNSGNWHVSSIHIIVLAMKIEQRLITDAVYDTKEQQKYGIKIFCYMVIYMVIYILCCKFWALAAIPRKKNKIK